MSAILRQTLLISGVWVLSTCVAVDSGSERRKWTFNSVAGLTILLIESPERHQYEWLRFHRNGTADSESGVSGPEFKEKLAWKLLPDGRLGIYSDFDIYDELTLISRTAKTIVAKRRTGEIVKYKILHEEPREHLTRRWS